MVHPLTDSLDYDPEDEGLVPRDDVSSEDDERPEFDGREHYEKVGKSRLRKLEQPQLGQSYRGVAVSRSDLDPEAENDPFAATNEDEDDDPFAARASIDEGSDDSDGRYINEELDLSGDEDERSEERVQTVRRVSVRDDEDDDVDGTDESESASEQDEEKDSDPDSHSGSDVSMDDPDEGVSDASSISSGSTPSLKSGSVTERDRLRALAKDDTSRVAANLSAKEDVKRGQAVKQQQAAYDRLLDARIKLQKGLTASNTPSPDSITDSAAQEAIRKAEAAALSLWSTIDSIRCTTLSSSPSTAASASKKRKRPLNPTSTTPLTTLWTHTQDLESLSLPHRRATLDHWSRSTRASAPSLQPHSRHSSEPPLTSIIDAYLTTETPKLIASNTNPPPNSISEHASTYFSDDTFYNSLLRDLVASRTNQPFPPISSTLPAQVKPAPINNQKNRRQVDTKASKGRKIRYTVHEKLVSFMAPEDRSTWTKSARREFFGSLFGGQPGFRDLDARGEQMDWEGEHDGVVETGNVLGGGAEDGVLRMFRS